ncbi:2-oxoacid:ferredoxin oxidoreductase subunit beta [Halanaerobiaceae bacterium Z-7014]|uniref:2-oxoacid:ferredoxin oxidoreductase subunit beta n=1 Tax=Halonatronomonas betaini TaxID=2778430 RepID=A0A931AQK9_9FIRM|nr:2-oxoacid:ferredoxin oxidoreductase subunit beta [Halonatronomonas betaini]MBF8437178.1 2-oxoacid:ferredoxin oxidoreductase subunit beta [Halonatronomonas betaini]
MDVNIDKYLRQDKLPHIWCPGCGHGTVLGSFVRAFDQSGLDQDKTVVISGIGCSGRASGYLNFDTLHVTHGRALTFATGVKMANPELNVIVMTGDGDGAAIGGNHLIHSSRRNIDITVVLFNNNIYGMTGGQFSPMTPTGDTATTSPYGNIDQNFDLCELAKSSGATFVGRGASYQPRKMIKLMKEGLLHKGFAFVETLTQCPVNYGKRNKIGGARDMLKWQDENLVPAKKYEKMDPAEREGLISTGILHQVVKEEYTDKYKNVINTVMAGESNE